MPQRIHPKSASLRELFIKFSTEEQCLEYVEKMRWPDGVVRCPTCGDKNVKRVMRTAESKNKRPWFYLCLNKDCHQQFSPTAGTLFADSHLPLIVWFQAIALMLNAKKGISALQLQRDLGIGGYKTAWYLNHRIREAMANARPRSGITAGFDHRCDLRSPGDHRLSLGKEAAGLGVVLRRGRPLSSVLFALVRQPYGI